MRAPIDIGARPLFDKAPRTALRDRKKEVRMSGLESEIAEVSDAAGFCE
ncbi:hypothetical protein [Nocardia barduliensis]|nr:hypothetical protein [Nocardia barduliensis]